MLLSNLVYILQICIQCIIQERTIASFTQSCHPEGPKHTYASKDLDMSSPFLEAQVEPKTNGVKLQPRNNDRLLYKLPVDVVQVPMKHRNNGWPSSSEVYSAFVCSVYCDQEAVSFITPSVSQSKYKICCSTRTPSSHITEHLPPPVGSLGFCDFSISAIMVSKARETLVFNLALASVKPQWNSSASFAPSSVGT